MSLDFYDIVQIEGPLAPEEVRGKTGYVIGRGVNDIEPVWGVFVYDLEMVWTIDTGALTLLGYKDAIAAKKTAI